MFNLSDNNRGSRSTSPAIVKSGKPTQSVTQKQHPSTGTSTMFDLSKRPASAKSSEHGYIPGARPRPTSNTAQSDQSVAPVSGGRKRSVSRESKEPPETKTIPTAVPATDISKLIPVGSQKIPYDEIVKLLDGYVSLPKEFWDTELIYRRHIRYTKIKDNVFVRGGFIVGVGKQRSRATLTLANGFDSRKRGYYSWIIALDSISHIFIKKPSAPPNDSLV